MAVNPHNPNELLSPISMEPLGAYRNNPGTNVDKRKRHDGRLDGDEKQPVRRLVVAGQSTGEPSINDERARAAEHEGTDYPIKSRDEMLAMIERRIQREVELICSTKTELKPDQIAALDKYSIMYVRHQRAGEGMTPEEYETFLRSKKE